jgi:hypothetical protein
VIGLLNRLFALDDLSGRNAEVLRDSNDERGIHLFLSFSGFNHLVVLAADTERIGNVLLRFAVLFSKIY